MEKYRIANEQDIAVAFSGHWKKYAEEHPEEQTDGRFIGAWGDPHTNSIVVYATPKAETQIRMVLATLECAVVGIPFSGESLEEQLFQVERDLRATMASLTIVERLIAKARAKPRDESGTISANLVERVRQFEVEVEALTLEREVILKNMKRLEPVTHPDAPI